MKNNLKRKLGVLILIFTMVMSTVNLSFAEENILAETTEENVAENIVEQNDENAINEQSAQDNEQILIEEDNNATPQETETKYFTKVYKANESVDVNDLKKGDVLLAGATIKRKSDRDRYDIGEGETDFSKTGNSFTENMIVTDTDTSSTGMLMWKTYTYKVSLSTKYDTISIKDTTNYVDYIGYYENKKSLDSCPISKTGYTPNLYTDNAGSEEYTYNNTIENPLYVKWTPIKYTIEFTPNGASGDAISKEYTYDDLPVILAASSDATFTPTEDYYVLDGWSYKGQKYELGAQINQNFANKQTTLEFEAVWKDTRIDFPGAFNSNILYLNPFTKKITDADNANDKDVSAETLFNAVIDAQSLVASGDALKYDEEYYTVSYSFSENKNYTNDLNGFGENTDDRWIKIEFKGNENYKPGEIKKKINVQDPREDLDIKTVDNPSIYWNPATRKKTNENNENETELSAEVLFNEVVASGDAVSYSAELYSISYKTGNNKYSTDIEDFAKNGASSQDVRIEIKGNNGYKPITINATITLIDPRTEIENPFNDYPSYTVASGDSTISTAEIKEKVIVGIVKSDYQSIRSNFEIKYLSKKNTWKELNAEIDAFEGEHRFGDLEEETVRLSYAGNKAYQGFNNKEVTIKIDKSRASLDISLREFSELEYSQIMEGDTQEKLIHALYNIINVESTDSGFIVKYDASRNKKGDYRDLAYVPGRNSSNHSFAENGETSTTEIIIVAYSGSDSIAACTMDPVTVTIKKKDPSTVKLHSNPQYGYSLSQDKPAVKSAIFEQIVDTSASTPNNITVDQVDIEYKAGLLGSSYKNLNYKPSGLELLTMHAFGEKDVETIRVTYKGTEQYGSSEATVALKLYDPRHDSSITCDKKLLQSNLSVKYNSDKEALLKACKDAILERGVTVSYKDASGNAHNVEKDSLANYITVTCDDANVKLLQSSTVNVIFAGNTVCKGSATTTQINFTQDESSLEITNKDAIKNVEYSGQPVNIEVDTKPGNLEYIKVIAGLDGNFKGFVGLDVSDSMKERIMREIVPQNDSSEQGGLIGMIGGFIDAIVDKIVDWTVDSAVEQFNNMIIGLQDEMDATDFKSLVNRLNELLQTDQGQALLEKMNLNPEVFDQIIKVINALPDIGDNITIKLIEAPSDAGLYSATVISTDMNYKLATDSVTYRINKKDAQIVFNENDNKPVDDADDAGNDISGIISQAQKLFQSLDLLGLSRQGATAEIKLEELKNAQLNGILMVDGKKETKGTESIKNLFIGRTKAGKTYIQTNKAPTEAGTYLQVCYLSGGNYEAASVSRTLKITSDDDTSTGNIFTRISEFFANLFKPITNLFNRNKATE